MCRYLHFHTAASRSETTIDQHCARPWHDASV